MPEKKKPKYQIIEDYLLERINNNELRPGDQIETEMELSQKFNIGRLTVNKALNYLATEGYIERIAGKNVALRHRSGIHCGLIDRIISYGSILNADA